MKNVDFGRTTRDYSRFRAGFPEGFFDRLAERDLLKRGIRALDLGTGTGTVARGMAKLGVAVTGCDVSEQMIEQARELDAANGIEISYVRARAEDTSLHDESFDLVTCGQCWQWFDRATAARECHRLLRAGGHVVIDHFDWLPIPGNVVAYTEELILKFNPKWTFGGGAGIYPAWFSDLAQGGFIRLESWTFDVAVQYSHDAWRGRIRASAGVAASLPEADVERFDVELRQIMATHFPMDPLSIPHRVFTLVGQRPLRKSEALRDELSS